MNKKISKLPNGDFQVEPDTTVYGIRKMLRPKHDYWNDPIKRNRKEQLTMEEIEYRHARNSMDQMEGWPTGEVPGPWSVTSETKDPNIVIIDSIIQSAHHRIAMYETLDKGLWNSIFGTDNTDEIVKERELIREFEQMKQEIILWQTKNTTQQSGE